jgi:hypothetical protein
VVTAFAATRHVAGVGVGVGVDHVASATLGRDLDAAAERSQRSLPGGIDRPPID